MSSEVCEMLSSDGWSYRVTSGRSVSDSDGETSGAGSFERCWACA